MARQPGEWQTFDITLVGRLVTVVLNGKTVIGDQEILNRPRLQTLERYLSSQQLDALEVGERYWCNTSTTRFGVAAKASCFTTFHRGVS